MLDIWNNYWDNKTRKRINNSNSGIIHIFSLSLSSSHHPSLPPFLTSSPFLLSLSLLLSRASGWWTTSASLTRAVGEWWPLASMRGCVVWSTSCTAWGCGYWHWDTTPLSWWGPRPITYNLLHLCWFVHTCVCVCGVWCVGVWCWCLCVILVCLWIVCTWHNMYEYMYCSKDWNVLKLNYLLSIWDKLLDVLSFVHVPESTYVLRWRCV